MPSSPSTPLSPSAHTDTFCRDRLPPRELWPSLRPLPTPARLNCATELLDVGTLRFGADRPCLRTPDGGCWTYGDLLRRSNRIARVLTEHFGLVPGGRVLLRGPNNPWLVATWFAVLRAGGVVVTSVPLLRAGEVAALAEVTRPALAVCDHRWTAEAEAALSTPPAGTPQVPLLRYGDPDAPDDLIALARKAADDFAPVPTAPDDVALLAPTSGTTGRPKATVHFHRDVLAVADTFSRSVLRPRADDLFTGSPPLGFTFGLGGQLVFPLRAGAATLLLEAPTPDRLLDAATRSGATVLFTAPTGYRAMLAQGPEAARALGGFRRCVSAGEPLPGGVWEEAHRAAGIRIIDGIGSTELLHIFLAAADEDIRPGSTGRAVPGYRAEVQDEQGRPVPDGAPGLLAVQGPTGCRYLSDEQHQRAYVRNGWNLTGDTYLRDGDGYFWFQARSDDMIVSAGYNIAGPEVEQALTAHQDVLEAAVVAAPDERRGHVAAAYVVLAPGVPTGPAKAAELQEFAKRRIAPYKYPRIVEFVDELPRTSTGKIQRYQLRKRAEEEAASRATEPQ
jgi:2-aminobenzoate-CoA ligase